MQGRNYANPEDKGRFGFSASGKFNAPYKLGFLVIAAAAAAAVVAVVLTVIFSLKLMRSNITGVDTGRLLEALIIGIPTVIVLVLVMLALVFVIKFVNEGFKCSYIADEDKFTADIGGTHRKIYYKDVQTVHFQPRTFMGKVNGYDVTVKVNGINEEFAIVSSGYISEKSTPFYIIKERSELLRSEEEKTRELEKELSAGGVSNKPDSISADNAAFSLGMKAEMPGVSARNIKREMPSMPEVGALSYNGASDMPEVGPSLNDGGRVIKQVPSYTDENGRERSITDIVARGSFREAMKPWKAALIGIIGITVYVLLFYFVDDKMITNFGQFGRTVGSVVMIIFFPFFAGTIINFLRNGKEYRYSANGREFVICAKGKPDEHILYSDVQSVDYKPTELLWFIKGYRVEILTKYGVLKYNYVFPGLGKKQRTEELPFEEIRKRIGGGHDM